MKTVSGLEIKPHHNQTMESTTLSVMASYAMTPCMRLLDGVFILAPMTVRLHAPGGQLEQHGALLAARHPQVRPTAQLIRAC